MLEDGTDEGMSTRALCLLVLEVELIMQKQTQGPRAACLAL